MMKIVVSGALGKMGKRIVELAGNDPQFKVVGKLEKEARPEAGIVNSLNGLKENYDCIIEFTTPEATVEHVRAAKILKKAMVIGTTGLSDAERALIKEASKVIPIVFSPNMSPGVNLFLSLVEKSAKVLGDGYKVRIKEAHHIHKKDKPSGTAKLMKKIVEENLKNSDIPIESIRENEIVGDHEIIFESGVDTLKISHSAKTRDIFALGALLAAAFVGKKKKGFFSMQDALGVGNGNKN